MLKRLINRVTAQVVEELPRPKPAQINAAADLQKTMGRDRITGLPHRTCFAHVLMLQGQIAARLETRLSVVVLDWPGYTTPGLGQDIRDQKLMAMAEAVRECLHRTHDVLGALGEGRLAAILPFTDAAGADTVAHNLQRAARLAIAGYLPAKSALQRVEPLPPAFPKQRAPSKSANAGAADEKGAQLEAETAEPDCNAHVPASAALDNLAEMADDDSALAAGDNFGQAPQEPADWMAPDLELNSRFSIDSLPGDSDCGETVAAGLSCYNGKGMLADDALLKAAERAVTFALLNGGAAIVRFDPGADPARQ